MNLFARAQKDFIIWVALWIHLWWGIGGLWIPDYQVTHAAKTLYNTGLLPVKAWSIVFLLVALGAMLSLVCTGRSLLLRVALLIPQQILLIYNVIEIYAIEWQAGKPFLATVFFLPVVVPVNILHTLRMLLFIRMHG